MLVGSLLTNLRGLHSRYLCLNSSAKLNCQKSTSSRFTLWYWKYWPPRSLLRLPLYSVVNKVNGDKSPILQIKKIDSYLTWDCVVNCKGSLECQSQKQRTCTAHAQVWMRETMEKNNKLKRARQKNPINMPPENKYIYIHTYIYKSPSYLAQMTTLKCVYYFQLTVERVLLPWEVEIYTVE